MTTHAIFGKAANISAKSFYRFQGLGIVDGVFEEAGQPNISTPIAQQKSCQDDFDDNDYQRLWANETYSALQSERDAYTADTSGRAIMEAFLSGVGIYDLSSSDTGSSIDDIISLWSQQMSDDSEEVVENTCTCDAINANGSNAGQVTLYTYTKVAGWNNDTLDSENINDAQTIELEVTTDTNCDNDEDYAGKAVLSVLLSETNRYPAETNTRITVLTDTIGTSIERNVNTNIVSDGCFNNSLASGSGGGWSHTGLLASGNPLIGSLQLRVPTGNSEVVKQTLGQNGSDLLEANELYHCEFAVDTNTLSSGSCAVYMSGTGVALALTIETLAAATTNYERKTELIRMPNEIPQDMFLAIKADGLQDDNIDFDSFRIAKVVTAAPGVKLIASRYDNQGVYDDLRVGDKYGPATMNNDRAGKIQTFIGDSFGRQLPSAGSASTDYAETLL